MPQKLTVPPQIKNIPWQFTVSCISSVSQFFLLLLFVLSLGLQSHQVFVSKLLVLHSRAFSEVVLWQIWLQLRVTKLIKTSSGSSLSSHIHENWEQTASSDSSKPHCSDGHNLMPSKVNVFYGFVDVIVLSELSQDCSCHLPLPHCEGWL